MLPKSCLSKEQVTAMHSTSIGDVDDMAKLGDLHKASILYNLSKRYQKDTIYVSIFDECIFSLSSHYQKF